MFCAKDYLIDDLCVSAHSFSCDCKVCFFADSIMSVSLSEICENTKMGREYALLGNYETSQVYYQAVLQQIQKLLTSINDQARKSKWNQVIHLYNGYASCISLFSSRLILQVFSFCHSLKSLPVTVSAVMHLFLLGVWEPLNP